MTTNVISSSSYWYYSLGGYTHTDPLTHCADFLSGASGSEWRSGVAGHLILSDEDLTSVVQGSWKRLNTLQHYKVRIPAPQSSYIML